MDVELQIQKHLKRDARPTVSAIDKYCSAYNDLFSDVRSYECFKYLHQGIISAIKRKSLPEISKVVGISSAQSLHHFIANSSWSVKTGWKATWNNFRLIIQPTILLWMISPWLDVFPNRSLLLGFHQLIAVMNQFSFSLPDG